MPKNNLLLLSGLLLFASCQSVQYVPLSYSVEKPSETIAVVSDEQTEMYMEHMSKDGGQLVFDLDVWNNSSQSIRLNPNAISIFGSNEPFPEPDMDSLLWQARNHAGVSGKYASTQEEVNKYFRQKVRSQQAAQVALLVIGVALAVNDAVNDSKDSRQEFWSRQDERRAIARDITTFTGLIVTDMMGQSIENSKFKTVEDLQFLPEEYLNEGTLFPDGHSRGKVFFSYPTDFAHYRIIVPMNGYSYVFDFRKPNASERQMLRRIQQ